MLVRRYQIEKTILVDSDEKARDIAYNRSGIFKNAYSMSGLYASGDGGMVLVRNKQTR